MKSLKFKNKIRKFTKEIITSAYTDSAKLFFKEIKEFQEIASKIPKQDQDQYEKYFDRYMIHEINLVRIELKKIEMNYKESVHRTSKRSEKFETELADEGLTKDMRIFYQKEYLNILKPMSYIEQVLENFKQYLKVLRIIHEEFSEWFFLGRIDFLKQLLQPYIVIDDSSRREKEIWIYKKYEKELTEERKEKMFQRAGLST